MNSLIQKNVRLISCSYTIVYNMLLALHKNSVNPNSSPFIKPVNWVSSKKKWITAIFFLKYKNKHNMLV